MSDLPIPVPAAAAALGYKNPRSFVRMAAREGLPLIEVTESRKAVDRADWSAFLEQRKIKPESNTQAL